MGQAGHSDGNRQRDFVYLDYMSPKILFVPTYMIVVFHLSVFAGPSSNPGLFAKPSETANINEGSRSTPLEDSQVVPTDDCAARFTIGSSVCHAYLNPSTAGRSSRGPEAGESPSQTLNKIDQAVEGGVAESRRRSRACIQAAETCARTCGAKPENLDKCKKMRADAGKRHENIVRLAQEDRRENDDVRDRLASQGPTPTLPMTSGANRESTQPQASASPRSTPAPLAAAESAKTPEQARQERRERKREESRQEKIDALGKAFMNLNQQQSRGQAIQERSNPSSEPRTQKAAVTKDDKPPKEDQEEDGEIGRAGFDKMAEKNLAARKKLAATLGVNPSNLPEASIPRLRAAAGSASSGFGSGTLANMGSFNASGNGARLDPIVKVEPPSDLPQNFRLEAPEGGGGRSGSSNQRLGHWHSNDRNQGFSPQTRGPAGLEDTEQTPEIRRRNTDIWNVISVSFRRHCALGHLMDCAEHLPK
jgi:hypothetical protein